MGDRPKTWGEITDEEVIDAVRFAAERDREGVVRGAIFVKGALCYPTPEQWPSQPPPPNALFGLGLCPDFGPGSPSTGQVAARLRKLAKAGQIARVEMVAPMGKPTSPGYRPIR